MVSVDPNFERYEDTMVFCESIFIILFKTGNRKGHLDENNFNHCYAGFFESAILEAT